MSESSSSSSFVLGRYSGGRSETPAACFLYASSSILANRLDPQPARTKDDDEDEPGAWDNALSRYSCLGGGGGGGRGQSPIDAPQDRGTIRLSDPASFSCEPDAPDVLSPTSGQHLNLGLWRAGRVIRLDRKFVGEVLLRRGKIELVNQVVFAGAALTEFAD